MNFSGLTAVGLRTRRIGIGTRIYAALGVATLLTLGASAVAFLSYDQIQHTVTDVVDRKMPTVELALELSRSATQSTVVVPRFRDVADSAQHAALTKELDAIEAREFQLIRRLEAHRAVDPGKAKALADQLSGRIAVIGNLSGESLRDSTQLRAALGQLDKARDDLVAVVVNEANAARDSVMASFRSLLTPGNADARNSLDSLAERQFPSFDLARKLEAQVNELVGLIREVSQVDDAAGLSVIAQRLTVLAARTRSDVLQAEASSPNPTRSRAIEAVIQASEGPSGIVAVRKRTLETRARMVDGLVEVEQASEALRVEVDTLVQAARDDALAGSRASQGQIERSRVVLGGIGVGSLLVAAGLALFFVRPMIIKRLERLWTTTTAIANGQLDTAVDMKGNDEICDISKSVLLFRDNALALRAAESVKIEDGVRAERLRKQMMEELTGAFSDVVVAAAAGEFSQRVSPNFEDNELNELANSINALLETVQTGLNETCSVLAELAVGNLSTRVNGLYQGAFAELKRGTNILACEFESTLARLSDAVAAVRSATREILDGVTDLAERTSQESNAVAMVTNQLGTFAGTVRKTAAEAAQAMGMAENAENRAQQGEMVVASALESMMRIRTSSDRISEVIAMIDEIAFQTNLLALNASVEAARAGDAGKGFAVVATEVRALAKRSADASDDVKRLVETAHDDVKVGAGLVEETSAMFGAIAASVTDLAGLMNGISQTARSQASDVSAINHEIYGIGTMANQNAALVEETNAALALTDEQIRALTDHIGRFNFRSGHVAEDHDEPNLSSVA